MCTFAHPIADSATYWKLFLYIITGIACFRDTTGTIGTTAITSIAAIKDITGILLQVLQLLQVFGGISGIGGIYGISVQVLRLRLQLPEHSRIQYYRGHTRRHRLHQHEAVQDRGAHRRRGVRTSYRSKRKYRPQQCWIQSELLHED